MAQAQGSKGRLLVLEESTWGTTPSVTPGDSTVLDFSGESLSLDQPRDDNPHLSGSREYAAGVLGRLDAAGDTQHVLNPNSHGWLWKAALGAPSTTGADPYTHVFTVQDTLPSYTIEKGFTDNGDYFLFTGMKLGQLALTVAPSGFAELRATWAGKGGSAGTSALDSSPTALTDNPFALTDANVTITEGGAAIATVNSLELTIDNELDGDVYTVANEGQRGDLPAGKCKVSGTLVALFDDLALYTKASAGTESSLVVVLQNGAGDGTAGDEKITITVPELLYAKAAPTIDGPRGVLVSLPFSAYYDDATEGSAIEVELINTKATY